MGWDAYSIGDEESGLSAFQVRTCFQEATLFVQALTGVADAWLPKGGLDCSVCARMLAKATGEDVYGDPWTAEKVKELNASASWGFVFEEDQAWAYWSARKFLETCAELGLGIEFSW